MGAPNPRLRFFLPRLKRGRLLDLAGGWGRNLPLLAEWQVALLDISEIGLGFAKGDRVVGDAAALPFPANCFDSIVCTYFLPREVDFSMLLKEGGTLFFETFASGEVKYRPDFPAAFLFAPERRGEYFRGLIEEYFTETDDGRHVIGTYLGRKGPR